MRSLASIDFALVAFDVEHHTGGIFLLDDGAIALEPVVRDGEEGAAQRVGMGDGGRVRVDRCLFRGSLFMWPQLTVLPRLMPGGEVLRIRQAGKESLDVIVCLGVTRDGVVDVIRRLLPRIEDDFFPGVIRVQRGDDPLDRIVEQDGADAGVRHLALFFVEMGRAEEGLVLPDRLAFVVEHRAPAADPALRRIGLHGFAVGVAHQRAGLHIAAGERHVGAALRCVATFGLDLLLDLAAEAVRVGEADLDFRLCAAGVGEVRLPRQRGGERRLAATLVAVEVVDNPCRRFAQQGGRLALRIGDKGLQRRERRIGIEVFQQIAEVLPELALHGGGDHHAQRVERYL